MRPHLAFAAALAIAACESTASSVPPHVAQQRTIQRWLTCEECQAGELGKVTALGTVAIPELSRGIVGLPDSVERNIRRSSEDAFVRARRQFDLQSVADKAARPLGDSATFIQENVGSFRALYQVRAAVALKAINPVLAKDTLRHALAVDAAGAVRLFRADVRQKLDSLATYP